MGTKKNKKKYSSEFGFFFQQTILHMYSVRASSNENLISGLVKLNIIKTDRIAEAMKRIDRANYAPTNPYEDCPQALTPVEPGAHGATISAPHMHAAALESLSSHLYPGAHVLDVGCGSGYLSAVLGLLVTSDEKQGVCVGIDYINELV